MWYIMKFIMTVQQAKACKEIKTFAIDTVQHGYMSFQHKTKVMKIWSWYSHCMKMIQCLGPGWHWLMGCGHGRKKVENSFDLGNKNVILLKEFTKFQEIQSKNDSVT